MIAYLEKHDANVEVPDDLGEKDLAHINENFEKFVSPQEPAQAPEQAAQPKDATVPIPPTDIPTGIPGVNVPRGTLPVPDIPKWVPNFYESYIKPSINALGPAGLAAQLESLPDKERAPLEAFATSTLKGFSSGLATPALSGIDQEEKDHPIASFGGQLTGGLGSLLTVGGALKVAGLGEVAEKAGEVGVEAGVASAQRFVPRAIMTGATFGTQAFVTHTIKAFQDGNVDLAQFGKDVLLQGTGGTVLGGIGGVASMPLSVASAGGLGFVMSKMEGADNREASLNAGLWAGFEFIGSFGKNEALVKEGIGHIEDAIDNYVKVKNPNLSPNGGAGHAIVTMEAQKYGGIDELAKRENALKLVEDINQKIRQGKIPNPIQTVEAQPQIGAEPSGPSASGQTENLPSQPSPDVPGQTGLGQAETRGSVFPATAVSSDPIIASHPDFVQLTNDATAVVDKYATERNIAPSNEFAVSLYHELHDVLGEIRRARPEDRIEVVKRIKEQYPDIEREFATLSSKLWTDKTGSYFERQVAGKYGSMRPKVATDAETVQEGKLNDVADAIDRGLRPGEIYEKAVDTIQSALPKEPAKLNFDQHGIPVRKPGTIVATVPTADGGTAKITHKMVLDEAQGMLQDAKDRRATPDPVVDFVRSHGGIKGFKGMEQEEFRDVPIHVRGTVAADEMAQMAYDRNLIEEPSADLLRNHLASVPAKGPEPRIGDFYDEAQRNLEENFSSYKPSEPSENINAAEKSGNKYQQELDFNSPYEEDKGNVPDTQGKTETTQPTVRGGFRAIQKPHLEVEFQENGYLMFPNRKIDSPADLAYAFKFLHNEARENFFLGAIKDGKVVAVEHMAVGTIDQVSVYPYETINFIDKQAADSFFLVHNHPSGEVAASDEDHALTNNLRRVMDLNGVKFQGHVIIDDTKFGFIDPDGNFSEQTHATGPAANKVPIVKKVFQWLRPKKDIMEGPSIANPKDAFELFKGIQRGHSEAIIHLMNTQNKVLNSIIVPQSQMNAGVIQRLAAAYRANGVIAVNSGLSDATYMSTKLALEKADIRMLDDIELSQDQMGFRTKRGRGVFEPKADYDAGEQKDLIPMEKENVGDKYDRLRREAVEQGLTPAQASQYAKTNLSNDKPTAPQDMKLRQQEFGAGNGVDSFGRGREGERSLFEPRPQYVEKEVSQQMKDSAQEITNIVSPSSAAPLASQITREQLGKMARSYDKAEASLKAASDLFNSQSAEQNTDFIDKMERGMVQTTPALEKIAKQLRILLDEKRTEIRALGTGKLDNFIENYFPHIWDQSEKKVSQGIMKAAKRPFEGSKAFLKKRVIEYFKDGIALGLTPVSFNPVDLVLLKSREMDKYLMAHRTLNAYKENGLAKFFKLGSQDKPADWIKIDDRISTVSHMTPEGLVTTGNYYAQPDAARIINNYLSPGLQKSDIYQAFRYAGNALNQFQLGFSAFHLGFTSMDAIVSKNALALNHLFKGHPIKAMFAAMSSPAAPISNLVRGDKLFKAWRGEGKSPIDEVMAQAMASAGGRAGMDQFYATKAADQMKKYFQAGKPIRGILNLPMSIVEATTKPILEYIVPRQKLGIFADIMKMEMENNPNMTHEEMRGIAQRAWDSVDNRMGQMVYDNLFWNRTFKDLLMASVRSVGWNLGTLRELGGGVVDAASMIKDLSRGKKTDLSYRTAYIMALTLTAGIGGAIYQYLKTGKGPEDLKDYFHPKNGGTDSYGNATRTDLPSYMKDVFAYTSDPIKTAENKLNPLLAIMAQMLNNKDYYGVKIRNEDDPVVKQALSDAMFILKQLEPFSIRNMMRNRETGKKSLADTIEPWIGFTPSRYDINQTKAEKLAHEISASHQQIGGRTQAQADRSKLLGDLGRRYRSGDETAQDDLLKAYQAGQITRRQMHDVIAHANMTPLQRSVQHFSAEETQRVYDKSTDEEKAQIERILERKKRSQPVAQETQ